MRKKCLRLLSCMMMMAAMILTGCSDDDTTSKFVYQFPEATTPNLAIDQKGTIEFESAGAWSMYTPSSWVKLIEEGRQEESISGGEGKHTVEYVITDANWGFSEQEATIVLVMNGQTVTVATITRAGKEPVITIYQSDLETYEDEEVTTIHVNWSENSSRHVARIKFSTNFDWKLEDMPSWIANDDNHNYPTDGEAGESAYFYFTGDYSNYDMQAMTAEFKVVGKNDPSISKTYTITSEGAENLFIYPQQLQYQGITFESNGKTIAINGVEINEYEFTLTVPAQDYLVRGINTEIGWDGSKFYGVEFEGEMAFQADWLDTGMLDYTEIGENVRTNSFYVGAYKNSGDVRTADLFAIPRSVVSGELNWDLGNMISNSGKLKPEYAKYLLGGVTQKAGEEETATGLSFKYGDMANNSGASLKKSTNSDLISFYMNEWGVSADNVYELTYDNPNSGTLAHISWDVEASEPFFEIAEENPWLKADLGYDYFTISMRPVNPAPSDFFEGGVVMVVDGKPVNAIHCILLNNTADE